MGTNKRIYRARALSWGLGESSSGKEQIAVEFQIDAGGDQPQVMTWYGYFTDAAFDRTIESMRNMGWKGDLLTDLTGLDANEVDLVVEDEEYEGKVRAKVQWVNKIGGLALKAPLSPEKSKAFAASMRDRIRAIDAAGGRKPTPPKASAPKGGAVTPEPPPHSDADDLPF